MGQTSILNLKETIGKKMGKQMEETFKKRKELTLFELIIESIHVLWDGLGFFGF